MQVYDLSSSHPPYNGIDRDTFHAYTIIAILNFLRRTQPQIYMALLDSLLTDQYMLYIIQQHNKRNIDYI